VKAEISQCKDGWLNITLSAETTKEASQLVNLAQNMSHSRDNGRGAHCHLGEETVKFYVSVRPVPSRSRRDQQHTWVQFAK